LIFASIVGENSSSCEPCHDRENI